MKLTEFQERTLRKARREHDAYRTFRPYGLEVRSAKSLVKLGLLTPFDNGYCLAIAGLEWLIAKGDA